LDPLGLPEPFDFEDSLNNPYSYVAGRPLWGTDPLGLFTLGPDAPARCKKKWDKIQPLLRNPSKECRDYFCQEFNADLDALLSSPFPEIQFRKAPGGAFTCHSRDLTADSTIVVFGKESCQSSSGLLHYAMHELGHYADCWNGGDSKRNEEDGCGAEVACFGFSRGTNCKKRGYPYR
jgi:hypothetical protein